MGKGLSVTEESTGYSGRQVCRMHLIPSQSEASSMLAFAAAEAFPFR